MLTNQKKRFFLICVISIFLITFLSASTTDAANKTNQVSIYRDSYGVPHVYAKNTYEIVEKVHLIFWTELRGVTLPYLNKRSSIVDRITKPLFLTPYKEICSGAFSTVSIVITRFADWSI